MSVFTCSLLHRYRLQMQIQTHEITINLFVTGYAYVAGACDRNATKHSSEAVGIVEDKGGFDGIIPMAHEVGHL